MHRSVRSNDVKEYSSDTQPSDIRLMKDEDIEYRSGTLYSSSGTTSVQILTFQQQQQRQLAEEMDPPSNLTDPNTFAVNGSYTLERMQCYTVSKSEAAQKSKRSVTNVVQTSLKATINKREYLCTKSSCSLIIYSDTYTTCMHFPHLPVLCA